jgi:hypothetical protein
MGVGKVTNWNVSLIPGQDTPPLEKEGVTIMVEINAEEPALVAVKLRLPVPVALKPIAVFELVQLKTVPAILEGEAKFILTLFPAHTC